MIVLTPTESELNLAGNVGVLRMIYAVRTKRQRRPGLNHEQAGPVQHIIGAIGEMMLAKHLNIYWSGTVGTVTAAADVGTCYQVRATDHPLGKLITHHDDDDDQPFILARVLLPDVHLMGWLWGSETKRKEHWRTDVPYPAFFTWPVRDMDTLPTEAESAHHKFQQQVTA